MSERLHNTHDSRAVAASAPRTPDGSQGRARSERPGGALRRGALGRATSTRAAVVAWGCGLGCAGIAILTGCATTDAPKKDDGPIVESAPKLTSIEVAEIEISGNGEDRFVSCPPAGELGQAWIPPVPEWVPSNEPSAPDARSASGATVGSQHLAATPAVGSSASTDGARAEAAAASRAATQSAITETFPDFRTCHYKGLRVDPTQDGHVAIVARVGPNGNVEKVEEYGACNLSSNVIECMRMSAGRLRFDPPPGGSMTVTIPAYFASLDGYKSNHATPNDAYTASAYITIEQARPQLHACEAAARKANNGIEASATLQMTLDARGHVASTNVNPATGNQALLMCAAQTFQSLTFDSPPAGRGSVLARVVFNPRAGSR